MKHTGHFPDSATCGGSRNLAATMQLLRSPGSGFTTDCGDTAPGNPYPAESGRASGPTMCRFPELRLEEGFGVQDV